MAPVAPSAQGLDRAADDELGLHRHGLHFQLLVADPAHQLLHRQQAELGLGVADGVSGGLEKRAISTSS